MKATYVVVVEVYDNNKWIPDETAYYYYSYEDALIKVKQLEFVEANRHIGLTSIYTNNPGLTRVQLIPLGSYK